MFLVYETRKQEEEVRRLNEFHQDSEEEDHESKSSWIIALNRKDARRLKNVILSSSKAKIQAFRGKGWLGLARGEARAHSSNPPHNDTLGFIGPMGSTVQSFKALSNLRRLADESYHGQQVKNSVEGRLLGHRAKDNRISTGPSLIGPDVGKRGENKESQSTEAMGLILGIYTSDVMVLQQPNPTHSQALLLSTHGLEQPVNFIYLMGRTWESTISLDEKGIGEDIKTGDDED
ncbi:hypothetical protein F0562_029681 [Nyssa sinensis]|uniref:Uncharacterized protein n=1 Tax=Nyssa sinensis TaxID=561372 RepID=A0A5J5B5W3_9ASTE|nr:hypothetical protein F0562_029681 [Nyssa sinensis]